MLARYSLQFQYSFTSWYENKSQLEALSKLYTSATLHICKPTSGCPIVPTGKLTISRIRCGSLPKFN